MVADANPSDRELHTSPDSGIQALGQRSPSTAEVISMPTRETPLFSVGPWPLPQTVERTVGNTKVNPHERKVAVPFLWPQPSGVVQEQGMDVIRQLERALPKVGDSFGECYGLLTGQTLPDFLSGGC